MTRTHLLKDLNGGDGDPSNPEREITIIRIHMNLFTLIWTIQSLLDRIGIIGGQRQEEKKCEYFLTNLQWR